MPMDNGRFQMDLNVTSPRSRKRPRNDPDLDAQAESNSTGILKTVRIALGSDRNVLFLFDFVLRYAPSLSLPNIKNDEPEYKRLAQVVVCPSKSLQPLLSIQTVECKESLSNIVDGVIWSLVQRRARIRQRRSPHDEKQWREGRNVLCEGYVLSSDHLHSKSVRPCPNMRPGILCTKLNSNVSFCKSSNLCRALHRLVGDDILRIILLHTTLLLPIEEDVQNSRGNYLLLCGSAKLHRSNVKVNSRDKLDSSFIKVGQSTIMEDNLPTGAEPQHLKNGKRKRKRKRNGTETLVVSEVGNAVLEPNGTVPRHSLFYSDTFIPKPGLPAAHALNRPKDCKALLNSMFHLHSGGKKRRKRWTRLRETGISMCDQIFERHRKCDYARLLERFCPVPACCTGTKDTEKTQNSHLVGETETDKSKAQCSLQELVLTHTPSEHILSFLGAILRRVFPPMFWGTEHNFQRVMHLVRIFLNLRRRELLPNKALMDGIRVTDLAWLSGDRASEQDSHHGKTKKRRLSRTSHIAATALAQDMMKWLFSQYLIPLLRSLFYVTEGEFCAKRVLYYRKPVWSMFRSLSMKSLLKKQYVEIDDKEAVRRLKEQSMGFSRLRLLPKKTGVRPLATLSTREFVECDGIENLETAVSIVDNEDASRPVKKRRLTRNAAVPKRSVSDKKVLSTNSILKGAFEVLRYEHGRNLHASGAGVFGLNEIYPLVRKFLQDVKGRFSTMCPQLYFTTVDIHRCYDNINQERLLKIAQKLLSEDDYLIQKYAIIHPFDSMGRAMWKIVKKVGPPENFQFVAEDISQRHKKSIVVDDVNCSLVKKETVLKLLQEHLLQHMVVARGRFGKRYLVQNSGIPQGSILSSLLCNLYYGTVEKELLRDVFLAAANPTVGNRHKGGKQQHQHVHLLVRIVDDFLLITTDRSTSVRFLEKLSNGSSELGVHINRAKTLVSYDVQLKNSTSTTEEVTVVGGDGSRTFFPWCGMLFDTRTGEVRVDYSRFAGEQARDALTIDRDGKEGRQLQIRMRSFVRPRSQPILFDPLINSAEVVVINFYQAMLLCSVKTVKYISEAMPGRVGANVPFILCCIDDVITYSRKLIQDRLVQVGESGFFGICRSTALYLGRDAFLSVFDQVKPNYNVVAQQLRSLCREQPGLCRRWGRERQMALSQFDLSRFFN